jgi:DNA polymerase
LERSSAVFGEGNPNARLMFIGEAPGADEDKQGRPFVGRAGKLLDKMIKAMGLEREEVYISNVVRCRPPQNRTPIDLEINECSNLFLEPEIEIIKPEIIVTLGAIASQAILGSVSGIGALRGRFHEVLGYDTWAMPTYHPAYLLRNPEKKREVWEDLKKVMVKLGM